MKESVVLGGSLFLLWGCGTVLGLNDYEISEDGATGDGDGDTGGSVGDGDGDTGGAMGDGDGDTGGSMGDGDGDTGPTCENGCDDENDCTNDACVDDECAQTTVAAGNACSGGVCNGVTGAPDCVRCLDDVAGDGQDSGCSAGAPICDEAGTPTCTGCENHADCNDNNPCTTDSCNGSGECALATVSAGTTCSGGVCNGVEGAEACVDCVDDAPSDDTDAGCSSGSPICFADACVACVDTEGDDGQDLGCTLADPICDDGVCVACTSSAECDDGISCTVDTCGSGSCSNTPNHSACPYNSDTGKCGTCTPAVGCEDGDDPTQGSQLLTNPAFDSGAMGWVEESSGGFDVITNYSALGTVSPHSINYCAWLGGADDEVSAIYQSGIVVPVNTVGARISGFMYRQTLETGDVDEATMTLRTDNAVHSIEVRTWNSADATWAAFTDDVDVSTWTSRNLTLRFDSNIGPDTQGPGNDHSSFFLDTLTLHPMVCP